MQVIRCELCGGGELIKKEGLYVCLHCGTKYTLEEARKLLGTVRIDRTDETENLKLLARRFMNDGDYSKASEYYEKALQNNANDAESVFYRSYCQAAMSQIGNIPKAMNGFANSIMTTYDLFLSNPGDDDLLETLWNETIGRIEEVLERKAKDLALYYKQNSGSRIASVKDTVTANLYAIGSVWPSLEKHLKNKFPDKPLWIARIRKNFLRFIENYGTLCYERSFIRSEKKRLKKEPELS